MPLLHLLAGCNAAGKTTLYERVIGPVTGLRFINADLIAKQAFPGDEEQQSYKAAQMAATARATAIQERRSFVAETVFSHPSKVDLVRSAIEAGYSVTLHVVIVPEDLAVVRARLRSEQGGHSVPEDKVRSRYRRLWPIVFEAAQLADETVVYDNSRAAKPFRVVARYRKGALVGTPEWPTWSPRPFQAQRAT